MRRDRTARTAARSRQQAVPATCGIEGGRYRPLSETDVTYIDGAICHILANVGFAEAPPIVVETVTSRGGHVDYNGRLLFPEPLFREALAGFQRNFTLHGQQPKHELRLSGKHVHVGSGGASPQVVDLDTGQYRDSTLDDLYNAARLVDALDHLHFFSRSLVARDMPNELLLDINTAYASLAGTAKHVCTSISQPAHVALIADMCAAIAGSANAFIERPFLSLNINHVVPPMRFHAESCEVMAEAARLGIPVHANSFGQLGASSPVTLAGSVVQNVAESLAGMIFAWLINPEVKAILGSRPMITDLRTGGMTGGSGEQALVMAATTQMAQYYDLPNTCIAGATDSKIPDAQSGYEKALTVTLAAQAGSNMITQAAGAQASLMSVAFESYVIDNDMLGSIMRAISPIDVNETTLATDMIDEIVRGEGHFLGHPETFQRMQSDFLYPQLADRRPPQEWSDDGATDMRERAQAKTREILATHFPTHISDEVDQYLRSTLDIRLPRRAMDIGRILSDVR
ncbi:MAG: trimethylamine methyltransferase family protein [Chloroflexota bacterium]